jgi:sec-independent protein translocase protein TatB
VRDALAGAGQAAGELFLMFDISWSEFLLIGVVALIVIGPKELPAVMRTLGQWTRKIRGMASEFQNQFQEAMREAEMTDLKKEVDDMAQDVKDSVRQLDPLKDVREDVESTGEVIKRSLAAGPEPAPSLPAAESPPALTQTPAETSPAALETTATPAAETPAPAPPEAPVKQSAGELESVAAAAVEPQSTEKTAQSDATERTG